MIRGGRFPPFLMKHISILVRPATAGFLLASSIFAPAFGAIEATFDFDSLAPGSAANLARVRSNSSRPQAFSAGS